MLRKICQQIDQSFSEMVQIRRHLHQYPELSFQEYKTAQYIANFYEELNIPYHKNVGGNGVIATLTGGKPGKTVALRADFDALPIQDEKDVTYKSTVDGIMHACGHDGHTASLLILAKVMKQFQSKLSGTLVFIHQHAEEYAPGGAKPIIESGLLDHVEAVFGSHLWATVPVGTLQISKDILMAGTDRFEIIVQGKGGHGGYPHETKDAIVIGAALVTHLQHIVSRQIDPLATAVISVGMFHGGNAFNIIADKATLTGTVRYLDQTIQQQIITEIENIVYGVCKTYGVTASIDYQKGYPPLINQQAEAELVLKASKQIPEIKTAELIPPVMGGEDFAYYIQNRPGAYFFTGAEKEGYPHHHPLFDFDERAMPIAAKTLIHAYFAFQK
ncbi:amidohydrolase [Virgibacillus soli]|uniref:Amidohydrolase n=1 Tax=Paracerasibacillus soli TaxID=480284 RepID=A0ABU5CN91_9BACI|nr:amidohydrolase [Virgibacillus soli]MDY0407823.1 amidohydrolase [Virgibacillus soli]